MKSTRSKLMFIMCLLSIAAGLSCRKSDITRPAEEFTVTEKFFKSNRSADPAEQSLVNFLQRKNAKQPFVEATVKKIGYPVWDKIMARTGVSSRATVAGMSEGRKQSLANTIAYDIYYVPFVRDSQNRVNAAMIIKASLADTSISYACDWQYKTFLDDAAMSNSDADKFAVFFMQFDNAVFGYTKFKVTDKSLFRNKYGSADHIAIKMDQQGDVSTNSINVRCADVTSYTWYCPFVTTGRLCRNLPAGECDHCPEYCTTSQSMTVCWEEFIDDGPPPPAGDGGGTSGDGTGGGGSIPPSDPCSGGDTPPTNPDAAHQGGQARVGAFSPPPTDPCGEPGWDPDPYELTPQQILAQSVSQLAQRLPLTIGQQNWLINTPSFAEEFVAAALAEETMTPEVIAGSMISLELARQGVTDSPSDPAYAAILEQYHPNPSMMPVGIHAMRYMILVRSNMQELKIEHPDWGWAHLFWEANKEAVQLGLDIVGLFPVVGEVADVLNGIIYSIDGNGTMAALSYVSAIPIVGWWSAGVKMAQRIIVTAGGKTALKWIRLANDQISFGRRGQLRRVLGLAVGDARQAHHLLPWEVASHNVIQIAARAPAEHAFHMNELINGIALEKTVHIEGFAHPIYNTRVRQALDKIIENLANNNITLTPTVARTEIEGLIGKIRTWIAQNPGVTLENIVIP